MAPTPAITTYAPPHSFRPVSVLPPPPPAAQFYQNPSVGFPPMMPPYQFQSSSGEYGSPTCRTCYQLSAPWLCVLRNSALPLPIFSNGSPLIPPRPPGALSVVPAVPRPLIPGIPGVRPVIYPIIRLVIPYIGKIAPSVENDFMMSLLQFCGPVKSWKRPQDPANGTPRGFGFCEFESAEGVLQALRLLTKFNIDGQELMLNNFKETQVAETDKEDGTGNDDKKSSPDRSRGYDRRSRDRDREQEKEREIERYERETERERVRKEREQRRKIEEAEREYEEHLKDWEYREREKEKQRQYEKERDKERERKRRKEILHDEEDEEDDLRKRWRRSALEDRRRKRLREKEDDLADRLKEEEEITESNRRDEEEKLQEKQRDESKLLSGHVLNGSEKTSLADGPDVESKDETVEKDYDGDSGNENHAGDEVLQNDTGDESNMTLMAEPDTQHGGSAPARKLGFGLVGSGKRAAVPSVFHEEEKDDARKEKKTEAT
ncbi:hypothetical protein OIU77_015252, partial [Salix suchowensis]